MPFTCRQVSPYQSHRRIYHDRQWWWTTTIVLLLNIQCSCPLFSGRGFSVSTAFREFHQCCHDVGSSRVGYGNGVPWRVASTTGQDDVASRGEMELQRKAEQKREKRLRQTRELQRLLPTLDATLLASKAPQLLSPNMHITIPGNFATLKALLPALDVERLVRLHPQLLLYDVEKTLAPRIKQINNLFPTYPKLLMRAPDLLFHDVETYTLRKIEELKELLPGVDVPRLVRREPTVIGLDIQGNVKQRLKDLAQLLPGQNVTYMVGKVPRLLTMDVSGMEQKLSSLRWLLGPNADLNKIIHRKPEVMISNVETTIANKVRQLQELFPEGDVVSMVERDATVLFYDFEKSVSVKVECWRERVTNVTELDVMIQGYPVLLSYSLDTSISRLDFLIQTNGTVIDAPKLRQVTQTARRDWDEVHGEQYRIFLERKVAGPKALRLWPGLYFDSDTDNSVQDAEGRVRVTMQNDDSEANAKAAATAHIKALEKKYGTNIKEAQLRFSSALRRGKYGASPSELDMVLYDIKTFDQQVRKLATGQRLKKFKQLLPGLNTDRLFKDFPNVLLMDLKKVEERVAELRELLAGGDVSGAVSLAPQLLLNDVQTCLRPRMTRLLVALSVNQLEGVLDADKVRSMVVRCPQLLLSDVRNVAVPSLQYVLKCTKNHEELGRRLFRDPGLLGVGSAPLARLQFTLEQYRNGTSVIPIGNSSYLLNGTMIQQQQHPEQHQQPLNSGSNGAVLNSNGNVVDDVSPTDQTAVYEIGEKAADVSNAPTDVASDATAAVAVEVPLRGNGGENAEGLLMVDEEGPAVGEDQSRLLPPVVVPQVLKCQLRDFIERNPGYVSFLAQRQGSPDPLISCGSAQGGSDVGVSDESTTGQGQVVFWERAVGARLSEVFRPLDSPYAQEKLKEKLKARRGRAINGQKEVGLSELDLLVGDVLYFNSRMGVLFRDKIPWMPPTVDLGEEINKLADDVEWGSRQISRLMGISSWVDRENSETELPSSTSPASSAASAAQTDALPSGAAGDEIAADLDSARTPTRPRARTAEIFVERRRNGMKRAIASAKATRAEASTMSETDADDQEQREQKREEEGGEQEDQPPGKPWLADALRNLWANGNTSCDQAEPDDGSVEASNATDNTKSPPSSKGRRGRNNTGVSKRKKAVKTVGRRDIGKGAVESGGGGGGGGDGGVLPGVDRETALELEKLLGEVSSYEGRLEGLLDMQNVVKMQDVAVADGDDQSQIVTGEKSGVDDNPARSTARSQEGSAENSENIRDAASGDAAATQPAHKSSDSDRR